MLTFLERIAELIGAITSVVARAIVIFIAGILFLQVVLRYVFGFSLPWPEEAARYLMIWAVMLGGSLLVKDGQLVSVDFFDKVWSRKVVRIRNLIFRGLLVLLLAIILWQGIDLAMFNARRTTSALQISWFWVYLSIPVGAGLMLFHMIVLMIGEVVRGPSIDTTPTILRAEI